MRLRFRTLLPPLLAGCLATAAQADAQRTMDPADQKKIERLSEKSLQRLNDKLRQAMMLYYSESYRLALPLFREIAAKLDTLDVMYWLGRTAARGGQPEIAAAQFEAMLERHPELQQVRIELALVYLQLGRLEEARQELERVLTDEPPAVIRERVDALLERLRQADRPWRLTFRGSAGLQYDDNVTAQAGNGPIPIDLGTGTLLANTYEDWAKVVSASLDHLYDIGVQGEFVWRSRVSFYGLDYSNGFGGQNVDFRQWDFRTGLERYGEKVVLKLPLGYIDRSYGNQNLSWSPYFTPELEYKWSPELTLSGGLSFQYDNYVESKKSQDANTTGFHFGPRLTRQGEERLQVYSLDLAYADKDARDRNLSYDGYTLSPSYFVRFGSGPLKEMELYLQGRLQQREYDGPGSGYSGESREDRTYGVTVMVNKPIDKRFSVSLSVGHTRNDSNRALYDYDKNVVGLNFALSLDH